MSQVFGAITIGFILFLGFGIFQFELGLKPVINSIRQKEVVTVFLNPALSKEVQKVLIDSIDTLVGAKTKFVDQKQFLKKMNKLYPDLGEELYQLGSEYESIIPQYVSIEKRLPKRIIKQIKNAEGVELVEKSSDEFLNSLGAFESIRGVILVLLVGLSLTWIILNLYLSRMNSHLQLDFVQFLKLWGAENWLARVPPMISGGVVGLIGSLLAAIALVVLRSQIDGLVQGLSPALNLFQMSVTLESIATLFGVGVIGGALLGWLGSRTPRLNKNEIFSY